MCSYEKPVNFNTDKMKCSGTHFMTDELSSRVEGQLDRTMYKAPVIVISPYAYCLLPCLSVHIGFNSFKGKRIGFCVIPINRTNQSVIHSFVSNAGGRWR